MTEPELEGFLARTGAQLAVHTVSHSALPFLSDAELVDEVGRCHEALGARFRDVLPYLAIPFGLFDARTLRLAAKAGMLMSLTLAGSPLDRPFDAEVGMPRLCVVTSTRRGSWRSRPVAWPGCSDGYAAVPRRPIRCFRHRRRSSRRRRGGLNF